MGAMAGSVQKASRGIKIDMHWTSESEITVLPQMRPVSMYQPSASATLTNRRPLPQSSDGLYASSSPVNPRHAIFDPTLLCSVHSLMTRQIDVADLAQHLTVKLHVRFLQHPNNHRGCWAHHILLVSSPTESCWPHRVSLPPAVAGFSALRSHSRTAHDTCFSLLLPDGP